MFVLDLAPSAELSASLVTATSITLLGEKTPLTAPGTLQQQQTAALCSRRVCVCVQSLCVTNSRTATRAHTHRHTHRHTHSVEGEWRVESPLAVCMSSAAEKKLEE